MEFKVFDTKSSQTGEVYLAMTEDGDGEVTVRAVHQDGSYISAGCLLRFKRSGVVKMLSHVDPGLGLKLTPKRHVQVEYE